ncbi:FAD:protein FMN transferase [Kitasatospora sp. NPDC052896]|uniref:FAD:protein FMN transferase n=1 Tax=Kitasatospora sp. NPDC052896 TaxID=3364061 RepID=UPI0037CB884A
MLRHVEHAMGTVFSFAVRGATADDRPALSPALAELHRLDALFSTYRPESEISRLRRGELTPAACDPLVTEALAQCATIGAQTGGWFSAEYAARAGDTGLDPTGWVKGWAVERASRLLTAAGYPHHSITGGGDVQTSGEAAPGRPWRIGIADPARPGHLVGVLAGRDLAVATSGTAERGAHILDPHTGRPALELLSLTLVGRGLARTDACATAAFAMGPLRAMRWTQSQPDLEALAILPDGRRLGTAGFGRHLLPTGAA